MEKISQTMDRFEKMIVNMEVHVSSQRIKGKTLDKGSNKGRSRLK